jgi:hypothetical protein
MIYNKTIENPFTPTGLKNKYTNLQDLIILGEAFQEKMYLCRFIFQRFIHIYAQQKVPSY